MSGHQRGCFFAIHSRYLRMQVASLFVEPSSSGAITPSRGVLPSSTGYLTKSRSGSPSARVFVRSMRAAESQHSKLSEMKRSSMRPGIKAPLATSETLPELESDGDDALDPVMNRKLVPSQPRTCCLRYAYLGSLCCPIMTLPRAHCVHVSCSPLPLLDARRALRTACHLQATFAASAVVRCCCAFCTLLGKSGPFY